MSAVQVELDPSKFEKRAILLHDAEGTLPHLISLTIPQVSLSLQGRATDYTIRRVAPSPSLALYHGSHDMDSQKAYRLFDGTAFLRVCGAISFSGRGSPREGFFVLWGLRCPNEMLPILPLSVHEWWSGEECEPFCSIFPNCNIDKDEGLNDPSTDTLLDADYIQHLSDSVLGEESEVLRQRESAAESLGSCTSQMRVPCRGADICVEANIKRLRFLERDGFGLEISIGEVGSQSGQE